MQCYLVFRTVKTHATFDFSLGSRAQSGQTFLYNLFQILPTANLDFLLGIRIAPSPRPIEGGKLFE